MYKKDLHHSIYSFEEPVSGSKNKSRFSFITEQGTGEKMEKREGGKNQKESSNNTNLLN